MTWSCPAIDHGISVFPDGRIRPCCQTSSSYSKPLQAINDPNRFSDLKSQTNPEACKVCWKAEALGLDSYRQYFLKNQNQSLGLQFLDLRHTNHCNLKCRYCNPHFSNQWARELKNKVINRHVDLTPYLETFFTDSLEEVYWSGGEPLIIKDHYDCLDYLIKKKLSHKIGLRYSTNFTVLDYKDISVFDLWSKFKRVTLMISLDAVGPVLNSIRSNSDWDIVKKNIEKLLEHRTSIPNLKIVISPVISILNFWFFQDLCEYANKHDMLVNPTVLYGPDYLSLAAVHRDIKPLAREILDKTKHHLQDYQCKQISSLLDREDNEYLFSHAIQHILLLDHLRNENLFDALPFKNIAIDTTLRNYEYDDV